MKHPAGAESATPAARTIGIFLLALAAGCTGDKEVPAMVSAAPMAIEQPRDHENLPASVAKPLDVQFLKALVRDTPVIGAITKITLRNEMDDLLQQFRAHYHGGQKTGAASLRQPYNMLVLKVLCLVQDRDPSLARTLSGSREAIWGILSDPEQFNSVAWPIGGPAT
jgi:hypothetical protein